jgi:hypothetical protein
MTRFNPFEFHHLYIGLGLMIAGILMDNKAGYIFFVTGCAVAGDDVWQHWIGGWSPLNLAFQWLWAHSLGLLIGWPFGKL